MSENTDEVAVVILAAGLGTRMKFDRAKVLHEIAAQPMICYVVKTACAIAAGNVILVVGHQAETVKAVVAQIAPVQYVLQAQQRGTGHAVSCALG